MQPLRVVLADDHSEFRKHLSDFLKRLEGIEVIGEVRDGYEAIAAAHFFRPDVVLLDISMLDISGLEAARQIMDSCPDTKVVFVTVHEEQTYRALAEIMHVDGFVCKSMLEQHLPQVLANIRDTLKDRRAKDLNLQAVGNL